MGDVGCKELGKDFLVNNQTKLETNQIRKWLYHRFHHQSIKWTTNWRLFLIAKNVFSVSSFKCDSKSSACFVWQENAGRLKKGIFKGAWPQSALEERKTRQLGNVSCRKKTILNRSSLSDGGVLTFIKKTKGWRLQTRPISKTLHKRTYQWFVFLYPQYAMSTGIVVGNFHWEILACALTGNLFFKIWL